MPASYSGADFALLIHEVGVIGVVLRLRVLHAQALLVERLVA